MYHEENSAVIYLVTRVKLEQMCLVFNEGIRILLTLEEDRSQRNPKEKLNYHWDSSSA